MLPRSNDANFLDLEADEFSHPAGRLSTRELAFVSVEGLRTYQFLNGEGRSDEDHLNRIFMELMRFYYCGEAEPGRERKNAFFALSIPWALISTLRFQKKRKMTSSFHWKYFCSSCKKNGLTLKNIDEALKLNPVRWFYPIGETTWGQPLNRERIVPLIKYEGCPGRAQP